MSLFYLDGRPWPGDDAYAEEFVQREPDVTPPERHTFAGWWEAKIADHLCPRFGCGGDLDEDFFCSRCGVVSLPGRPVEPRPDQVEELFPPELFPDG